MSKEKQEIPFQYYDEKLYSLIQETKISFDIRIGLNKTRKNVTLLAFSIPNKKIIITGGEVVKLKEINEITFMGRNAVKFHQEILPHIPEAEDTFFEGKPIFIYPFGEKRVIKAKLLKYYPYYFILHIKQKKNRQSKAVHTYKVKYKVFSSAYSFISPYPKKLISNSEEIYDMVKPGDWRDEAKEIGKIIKEILGNTKKGKLITFALKDGKEITGFFNCRKSWMKYRYRIYNPEGKEIIFVFKHAIDDIWEAEE